MAAHSPTLNVDIPEAPGISGLHFRRWRGEDDLPALVEVVNRALEADGISRLVTLEELQSLFRHPVNCDYFEDMLLVEVDTVPVGFVRVAWRDVPGEGRAYLHYGKLVPEWRRMRIGSAMLAFARRRIHQIAAGHPRTQPGFLQVFVGDGEPGTKAMLERAGYAPVRYSYIMVRPDLEGIPELPLPASLEVRPARPEHYRVVSEANEEAFREHWGYMPRTEEDYQRWVEGEAFQPDLWQVAWDGDQVAGMVLSFILEQENAAFGRKRGYTEDICVRAPWRRRGLARALIARSLALLKERGMQEAALGVDTENHTGALRLYESLGYRPVESSAVYRKPLEADWVDGAAPAGLAGQGDGQDAVR